MDRWVSQFRIQLEIPPPQFGGPPQGYYMLLSLESSEIIRHTTGPQFTEEANEAAFNWELNRYIAAHGRSSSTGMNFTSCHNFN